MVRAELNDQRRQIRLRTHAANRRYRARGHGQRSRRCGRGGRPRAGHRQALRRSSRACMTCTRRIRGAPAQAQGRRQAHPHLRRVDQGNTILQWCGIDSRLVEGAAERNPDKYGARTMGTDIPIVSEDESRKRNPTTTWCCPGTSSTSSSSASPSSSRAAGSSSCRSNVRVIDGPSRLSVEAVRPPAGSDSGGTAMRSDSAGSCGKRDTAGRPGGARAAARPARPVAVYELGRIADAEF